MISTVLKDIENIEASTEMVSFTIKGSGFIESPRFNHIHLTSYNSIENPNFAISQPEVTHSSKTHLVVKLQANVENSGPVYGTVSVPANSNTDNFQTSVSCIASQDVCNPKEILTSKPLNDLNRCGPSKTDPCEGDQLCDVQKGKPTVNVPTDSCPSCENLPSLPLFNTTSTYMIIAGENFEESSKPSAQDCGFTVQNNTRLAAENACSEISKCVMNATLLGIDLEKLDAYDKTNVTSSGYFMDVVFCNEENRVIRNLLGNPPFEKAIEAAALKKQHPTPTAMPSCYWDTYIITLSAPLSDPISAGSRVRQPWEVPNTFLGLPAHGILMNNASKGASVLNVKASTSSGTFAVGMGEISVGHVGPGVSLGTPSKVEFSSSKEGHTKNRDPIGKILWSSSNFVCVKMDRIAAQNNGTLFTMLTRYKSDFDRCKDANNNLVYSFEEGAPKTESECIDTPGSTWIAGRPNPKVEDAKAIALVNAVSPKVFPNNATLLTSDPVLTLMGWGFDEAVPEWNTVEFGAPFNQNTSRDIPKIEGQTIESSRSSITVRFTKLSSLNTGTLEARVSLVSLVTKDDDGMELLIKTAPSDIKEVATLRRGITTLSENLQQVIYSGLEIEQQSPSLTIYGTGFEAGRTSANCNLTISAGLPTRCNAVYLYDHLDEAIGSSVNGTAIVTKASIDTIVVKISNLRRKSAKIAFNSTTVDGIGPSYIYAVAMVNGGKKSLKVKVAYAALRRDCSKRCSSPSENVCSACNRIRTSKCIDVIQAPISQALERGPRPHNNYVCVCSKSDSFYNAGEYCSRRMSPVMVRCIEMCKKSSGCFQDYLEKTSVENDIGEKANIDFFTYYEYLRQSAVFHTSKHPDINAFYFCMFYSLKASKKKEGNISFEEARNSRVKTEIFHSNVFGRDEVSLSTTQFLSMIVPPAVLAVIVILVVLDGPLQRINWDMFQRVSISTNDVEEKQQEKMEATTIFARMFQNKQKKRINPKQRFEENPLVTKDDEEQGVELMNFVGNVEE
eukprot:g941.t1